MFVGGSFRAEVPDGPSRVAAVVLESTCLSERIELARGEVYVPED